LNKLWERPQKIIATITSFKIGAQAAHAQYKRAERPRPIEDGQLKGKYGVLGFGFSDSHIWAGTPLVLIGKGRHSTDAILATQEVIAQSHYLNTGSDLRMCPYETL
jgi:hypothetical protein